MIEVRDLVKLYGERRAVDGLSFTVGAGEILGLVGPNGAGKTTTLRCLCGIVPPTSGHVLVAGHDLATDPVEAKRRLAFVPDEPRLFDHLTAWDHLLVVSRLYGVEDGHERAARLLEEMGLMDRKTSYPVELSRGMKQKLVISMALLHRPQALILDEPLTGLDPSAIKRMRQRIAAAAAEGVAVLLSSHLLHLVEALCSRVLIVAHGRKLLEGTIDEIRLGLPDLGAEADLEEIFLRATAGHEGD
jgi:ABC-2 type transport system ATP-binding protein